MNILRRMIAQAGTPRRDDPQGGAGGADRAFRLALARAARDTMGLTLDVTAAALDRAGLAELVDMPPERSLIALLDENRGDGVGLLVISPPVLAGMIEMLTTGRVSPSAPPARKPTRTDAAMLAGLIDHLLQGLDQGLQGEGDHYWAEGWRYASFLDEARPLGLLLEDLSYRLIRAEVSLSGGAKSGDIYLALPEHRQAVYQPEKVDEPAAAMAFAAHLIAQVEGAEVALDAVIGRMSLPLARLTTLLPGEVLPMPLAGIDRIRVMGVDGRMVAQGKLGQTRGLRAIRISDAAEAPVAAPIPPDMADQTGAQVVALSRRAAG